MSIPNTGRGGLASTRSLRSSVGNPRTRTTRASCASRAPQSSSHGLLYQPCPSEPFRGSQTLVRGPCGAEARTQPRRWLALAAVAPEQDVYAAGTLVEFKRDKDRSGFGLLTGPDGKRNWRAVDVQGHSHSLKPQQITYVLPGSEYTDEDLQAIAAQVESSAADASVMQDAWEVVRETSAAGPTLGIPQMADLLFAEGGPAACCAAHRLLSADRTFFKQVGRAPPAFQARSEHDVSIARARLDAERKAEEHQAARLTAFRGAMAKPFEQKPDAAEWEASQWAESIRLVQEHALRDEDPVFPTETPRELLDMLKPLAIAATPQGAVQLLKELGAWAPHLHLAVVRAGLNKEFPPAALAQASELLAAPPPDQDASRRRDLTHLHVWAVDSADTTEVDDGVSGELAPDGGWKFWVHIADPTRWLARGSALDAEAARRTATLYLPTGSVPMFPKDVAETLFSLRASTDSCALSISLVFDASGAIVECEATPSTVRPQRLTYAALDERLAAADGSCEADLLALLEAAELRRRWRGEQGATTISMPDCTIRVTHPDSPQPDVQITAGEESDSPAHRLVSELMIAANEAFSSLGAQAGLALPYRGQAEVVQPSEEELAGVPEGICRDCLLRGRMTRTVCVTGGPHRHAGLGIAGYVQATSPIRRYADLLAHFQLKAVLRQEAPPLDADSLNNVIEDVQTRVREYIRVDRELSKYWAVEFFSRQRQESPERTYDAMLLSWIREDTGFARVILTDIAYETVLSVQRPAQLGERFVLRCALADQSTAELRFEEATETPPLGPPPTDGVTESASDADEDVESQESELIAAADR